MTYVANYRDVPTSTGTIQIKRYACSRSGAGAFGTASGNNVTTPIVQSMLCIGHPHPGSVAPGPLQFIDVKAQTTSGRRGADPLHREPGQAVAEPMKETEGATHETP